MQREITVLHCFGHYLPNTENWLYRLLKNQTQANRMVVARRYYPCDFYIAEVEYLRARFQRQTGHDTVVAKVQRFLGLQASRYWPWFVQGIARQLRSRHVDIVHSHFAHYGWRYQSLADRLGARHFVSFYGCDYENIPYIQPKWRGRYRSLFERADAFICEGEHGASVLRGMGCPATKVLVSRLGVDSGSIPYFERNKKIFELNLVQVASFREKKGHLDTVRAFARALETCPNLTLTLIGSGEDAVILSIDAEIASLGIVAKVRKLPGIDFSGLHAALADYHVFIHPSCHTPDMDSEGGAPIVLLDAQATGLPVISTRHCDIPDEVVDSETGILCAEHDVIALADAIGVFYRMDGPEYREYSRRARRHVQDHYEISRNAGRLVEIYRQFAEQAHDR